MVYAIFVDAFVGTPLRGFASAQAYLLALLIVGMSIALFKGFGKRVHYT
jgi:sn-glycerol 3-phosphate transport system permease protein